MLIAGKDIFKNTSASAYFLTSLVYIFVLVPTTLVVFTGKKIEAQSGFTQQNVNQGQSCFWLGWAAGGAIMMPFLDKLGRARPMFVLVILGLAAVSVSCHAGSAPRYIFALFGIGFCFGPACAMSYLLLQETVPSAQRSDVLVGLNIKVSLLASLMAIISFAARSNEISWQLETLAWYAPFLLTVLTGPAVINDPVPRSTNEKQDLAYQAVEAQQARAMSPVQELFGSGSSRWTMVATMITWSACALGFYGISYGAGSLSPNLYLNMILMGIIDSVVYLASKPILDWVGVQQTQYYAFLGAACSLLLCAMLPEKSLPIMICSLVGRFFLDVAFSTIYLLIIDCFTVDTRSAAMGIANIMARLAAAFAPQLAMVPTSISCLTFAALSLAAALSTKMLSTLDTEGIRV